MTRRSPCCFLKPSTLAAVGALLVAAAAHAEKPAALGPQSVKLPGGAASLKGLGESFAPNSTTGTGSYRVPLEVPPGFVAPSLALQYSGGKGKKWTGLGFSLPLWNVFRTTDKGAPSYDEFDRFAVGGPAINEELVRIDGGAGVFRLKNEGSFARFIRIPASSTDPNLADSWRIDLASGQRIYLGNTDDSRVKGYGRNTVRWYVTRIEDPYGHTAHYTYTRDQEQLYPDTIRYHAHAGVAHENRVRFVFQPRPDWSREMTYGAMMTTAKRLASVHMDHGGEEVRRYVLGYEEDELHSYISEVRMIGRPETGEALSMPTLRFSYVPQVMHRSGGLACMRGLNGIGDLVDGAAVLEDVTRDGLADILVAHEGGYYYFENVDGYHFAERTDVRNGGGVALNRADTSLADINGDGRRDIVWRGDDGFLYAPALGIDPRRKQFIGFGDPLPLGAPQQGGTFNWGSSHNRLIDYNGDGRIDLIRSRSGYDFEPLVLLNLPGDRLREEATGWTLPGGVSFAEQKYRLEDFNGDSVLDIVQLRALTTGNNEVRVWYGYRGGAFLSAETMLGVAGGSLGQYRLLDVNRDGQSDLVRLSGYWGALYLNNGRGKFFKTGEYYDLPPTYETRRILYADMNGNGTQDVVFITSSSRLCYQDLIDAPHAGLLERIDNGMGLVTELTYRSAAEYAVDAKWEHRRWTSELPIAVSVIERMEVTDSFGVLGLEPTRTVVHYQYDQGTYDGVEKEFRGFARVVETHEGDPDGLQQTRIVERISHTGRDPETGEDREGLKGKPLIERVYGPSGTLYKTTEHRWEQRWLCQETLDATLPTVLPDCSSYTSETRRQSDKDALVSLAVETATLVGHFEGSQTPRWIASERDVDAFGSVIREASYGEVRFAGPREVGDSFDLQTADLAYGNDETIHETDSIHLLTDSWLIGLTQTKRTYSLGDRTPLAQSGFFYDGPDFVGLPEGQAELGTLKRETAWLAYADEEPRWVDVARRAIDPVHGKTTTVLDAEDNRIEFGYDVTGYFGERESIETESGTLHMRFVHDGALGTLVSATDFAGETTSYDYDSLGRLRAVIDPRGSPTDPLVTYDYDYGRPERPYSVTRVTSTIDRRAGIERSSVVYSDGAGRTRLTKAQAEGGRWVGSGWTKFSPHGDGKLAVFDSFISGHDRFEPPPPHVAHTTTRYDALSRIVSQTLPATDDLPETETITTHKPLQSWLYSERDVFEQTLAYPAVTELDGLGRTVALRKLTDRDGNVDELTWTTRYDGLGRIIGFSDPQGNARSYGYDTMGRIRRLEDPNLATITYQYDDTGNIVHRQDALGQVQTWSYGRASRLLQRAFFDSAESANPSYQYVYHYDGSFGEVPLPGPCHLEGRISAVEYPTGQERYCYDERGRQTHEEVSLWDPSAHGSTFENQLRTTHLQTSEFSDDGQILAVHSPGGLRVDHGYNARLLIDHVAVTLGPDSRNVIEAVQYDAQGSVVRAAYDNGVHTCRSYNARKQLTGVLTDRAAETPCSVLKQHTDRGYQHVVYTRGFDGMASRIADLSATRDGITRQDATFAYDHLQQLTAASTANGDYGFDYDRIQNLTERTVQGEATAIATGVFQYGQNGAGPNMLTEADGVTYGYDAAGNLGNLNGYRLDYDVEGRLAAAVRTDGTGAVRYHYDPWGRRRLAIIERPGKPDRVQRSFFDDFQERDGESLWLVDAAAGEVEIRAAHGVRIDAALYDELVAYAEDPTLPKPLPEELIDLDGDGVALDADDLDLAADAVWTEQRVGRSTLVWRYHHKDQLTSTALVTDSAGDAIAHSLYHPYGGLLRQQGARPLRGFTGAETELDERLGLVQMGARYYALSLGRWATADLAIGESPEAMRDKFLEANLYSYGTNNPVHYTDPEGASPISVFAKLAAKQGLKKALKKLVKEGIESQLKKLSRKGAREILGDVQDMMDAIEDPWYWTAVELVPVAGDVVGATRFAKQAKEVYQRYDRIQAKLKRMVRRAERATPSNVPRVGSVPKPPRGRGSVPKAQRDPRRLFSPKERAAKRAEQGNTCPGCDREIDGSNSRGHHVQRHADGGKTTPDNHVEVCEDCHLNLHSPD